MPKLNQIKRVNRGFGLLEALVAVAVFSGGVLGIAIMQLKSLSVLSDSNDMSIAVISAADLADKMRANPEGVSQGHYKATSSPSSASCTNCTPSQMANNDIAEIYSQLDANLSGVQLEIKDAADGFYTIDITWKEKVDSSISSKSHSFTFLPLSMD